MGETQEFYSTLVANCIVNAFFSYTAIALNTVTIQALRKTSQIPKTLKILLLSLAASDLWVGLLTQPLFIAFLLLRIEQSSNSVIHTVEIAYYTQHVLFSSASFLGVVALTVDRYLAICLHLRYQELVTHRRVVAVVIATWVLSVILSLLTWIITRQVILIILVTLQAVFIITTGFSYYKIYAIIRRLKNQICALQIQQAAQNDGMANTVRLRKTAVGTFYVYIAFLACYGPLFCVLLSLRIYGKTTLLLQLWYYAMTLVFMNSSLNPLIYCLKMRQVRQGIIMEILRNIRFLSQYFTRGRWFAENQNDFMNKTGAKQQLCTPRASRSPKHFFKQISLSLTAQPRLEIYHCKWSYRGLNIGWNVFLFFNFDALPAIRVQEISPNIAFDNRIRAR